MISQCCSQDFFFQHQDVVFPLSLHINLIDAVQFLEDDSICVMERFKPDSLGETELVCFSSSLKDASIHLPLFLTPPDCLTCSCSSVEFVNLVNYMGAYFYDNRSLRSHFTCLTTELRRISSLLNYSRYYLFFFLWGSSSRMLWCMVHSAMVLPHLAIVHISGISKSTLFWKEFWKKIADTSELEKVPNLFNALK